MALADESLRQYPSTQSEWYWRFAGVKAHVLELQGKVNDSLALLRPDLPAQFKGTDFAIRRDLTKALDNAFSQRYDEATRLISEAAGAAEASHPELLGEVSLRRGTVCYLADNIGCAEPAFRAALQAARERKDPYFEAAALSGLGICYTTKEHYDEAIDSYRAAMQIAESAGARYSQAQVLGNTAWCYRRLGDYENALALYAKAQEVSRQTGIVSDEFYWLNGASYVYYYQGNYTAAESVLVKSLSLARTLDDKSILIGYLNALAITSLDAGQTAAAERYLQEASAIDPAKIDNESAMDLAIIKARIEQSRGDLAAAEKSWKEIAVDARADSPQKWEAQARLASLYARRGKGVEAEREYRHLLKMFDQVRASVKNEELRLSFLSSAMSFYNDYVQFLIAQRRIEDALAVAELSRARTLAEGLARGTESPSLTADRIHPQQLARRLNLIFLFYWMGDEQSYLWVVTAAKTQCVRLPKKSEIEPLLQEYRKAILDGRDVLTSQDVRGAELFAKLVAPAREWIPKNSRVVVLPGEGLYGLNFETLIVPDPAPHYWIEDVTLSEAGSLTLLSAATGRSAAANKSLLLVGNPEPASQEFPSLAQAQVEMQKVSAHFASGQCKVLGGKQATASAYLQSDPHQFAYLHFVTHGTASLTQPLESAVILSREGDSFKLYARDIVAHPLDAHLVTISACNGAGTRVYAGEGLVGLSWAFLRAGAHNVIASLWEVSDASSTGLLMDKLYEGLDRGEDPATALRNAKLSVLKSSVGTVFRKPFYWAPFQLYVGS